MGGFFITCFPAEGTSPSRRRLCKPPYIGWFFSSQVSPRRGLRHSVVVSTTLNGCFFHHMFPRGGDYAIPSSPQRNHPTMGGFFITAEGPRGGDYAIPSSPQLNHL